MSKSFLLALCVLCISAVTFAGERDAQAIAATYLESNRDQLQLTEADLAEYEVSDLYTSRHNGVTHVYLNQTHNGIRVFNGILGIHIDREGKVFYATNRWVSDLAGKLANPTPTLSAEDAILHSADHLNLIDNLPPRRSAPAGQDQRQVFEGGQMSLNDIDVRLVYVPLEQGVRLGWKVNIRPAGSTDWWDMVVDAEDGAVIAQINWTVYDNFDHRGAAQRARQAGPVKLVSGKAKTASAGKTAPAAKIGGPSYRGLALPLMSPDEGATTLIPDPSDPTASPFGWHDTNGAAGAEFTTTQGNNVHAYQDRDGNDIPSGDDPDGGAGLVFDFPANLTQPPNTYTPAATVNLFVWNNYIHDILYHYGFDEPGGNFQQRNYSGQGVGNDYVNAESQAGADAVPPTLNNANFSTPPDGGNPRMRMYEWVEAAAAFMTVNTPLSIAGSYLVSGSSFGGSFANPPGTAYDLQLVNDGTGTATDGCEALIGFTAGRVAVIDRGNCEFGIKALNAQNAGAAGVLVVNNAPYGTISMGPGTVGGSVTIPAVMVSQADGTSIKDALGLGGVNANFASTAPTLNNRDSDFDNGVIAHEYGHGVSNRLTGGPANTGCLGNAEQMGEGWSDFMTFALTAKPGDTGEGPLGVGTYLSYQPTTGPGIRIFPYSTDMTVNLFTYRAITSVPVPHGVGSVWCTMLWDLYWALVDRYGFDPDVYTGKGGNNLAIQLVLDGMKLQPCSPGFVDGRNAILAADQALTGGANSCLIWNVFSRRGLGVNASQGSSASVTDGVEDFTFQTGCCISAVIGSSPESVTGCEGDSVTLTVDANGSDLAYQWYLDGSPIPDATADSYTIDSLAPEHEGEYTCEVTNSCSSETSAAAVVSMAAPLIYGNAVLPDWNEDYPEPACGDVNTNGIYDVLDFIATIPVE